MAIKSNSYRAYSMEYGTFVGLSWGAFFLSYVEGICTDSALLMLFSMILGTVCLCLPFLFALRLNRKLTAVGEKLSYLQGLLFAISMLMYACLLDGLIIYAYFTLFDEGQLIERMLQLLTQPEVITTYRQMGMATSYTQMTEMLDEISEMSAFEKTLSLFNTNFIFSTFLSFFVAIPASLNLRKSKDNH